MPLSDSPHQNSVYMAMYHASRNYDQLTTAHEPTWYKDDENFGAAMEQALALKRRIVAAATVLVQPSIEGAGECRGLPIHSAHCG